CAKQVFAAVGELERLISIVFKRPPLISKDSEYTETFRSILGTCRSNMKDGSETDPMQAFKVPLTEAEINKVYRTIINLPARNSPARYLDDRGGGGGGGGGGDRGGVARAVVVVTAAAVVTAVSGSGGGGDGGGSGERGGGGDRGGGGGGDRGGVARTIGQALLLRSDQIKLIDLCEFVVFMTEGSAHFDGARIYELGVILKEFKTNNDAKKLMTVRRHKDPLRCPIFGICLHLFIEYWRKRHKEFPIDFESDAEFIKTMRVKVFAGKESSDVKNAPQGNPSNAPQGTTSSNGRAQGTTSSDTTSNRTGTSTAPETNKSRSVATETMGSTVKKVFKAAGLTLPAHGKHVTHFWLRKTGVTQALRFGSAQEHVEYVGWKSAIEALKNYFGDGTPEKVREISFTSSVGRWRARLSGLQWPRMSVLPEQSRRGHRRWRAVVVVVTAVAASGGGGDRRAVAVVVTAAAVAVVAVAAVAAVVVVVVTFRHAQAGFYPYQAYIIPRQQAEVPEELRRRVFPFLSDALAAKAAPVVLQAQEWFQKEISSVKGQLVSLNKAVVSLGASALENIQGPSRIHIPTQHDAVLQNHEINRLKDMIICNAPHLRYEVEVRVL
ncbi:hypothetical protein HDU96_002059, partial [Phlyctochytrium bullatum]